MKAKEEYDFSSGQQGAVVKTPHGKTRITIRLDDNVLIWFRNKVHESGGGNYQTLINDALCQYIQQHEGQLESTLRKVIREELQTIAREFGVHF
jgi:uncharacterized protein (DUF4415 family)